MSEKSSGLTFQIAKCVAWAPGVETDVEWRSWAAGERPFLDESALPALKSVPPMQRRRLSPFAKVNLHCALEATEHQQGDLPCVFSSRHGDLNRTTGLIENVAQKEDLSPTQFGLSVHNAVSGLYSIYTKNHAPISAVAAGETSFMVGLVDAVAKLHANQLDKILYVFADWVVPDCYASYVGAEKTVGVGLLLEAPNNEGEQMIMGCDGTTDGKVSENQALDFLSFYYSSTNSWTTQINQQLWRLTKT
ncbi:beta-ketoacyl synthase chain length factor [Paraglaciecola aquimarina]|uniref:Beta-ketoacyl synthase chain length factor n=1 Tax=Paraglaciecola aquimarina TaxID=1235557 RepID=A0ABU3SSR4_9ALTE|nr:beta-ketoacyl synthase chain length factor [Paraglaciecola aquimarina]MDU0353025.1 beta-ketoacyl synthase chain length factor [Paraglaciecola aquimarina]